MEDRLNDLIDYLNQEGHDKAISIDHTNPQRARQLDKPLYINTYPAECKPHRIRQGLLIDQPVLEANAPVTTIQYGTTEQTTITELGPGDEIRLYDREQLNRFVKYDTKLRHPTYISTPDDIAGITNPVYQLFLKAAHETGLNTTSTHTSAGTEDVKPDTIAYITRN